MPPSEPISQYPLPSEVETMPTMLLTEIPRPGNEP